MNKTVVIINGYPHSGKDEFVKYVTEFLLSHAIFVANISSVKPVLDMLAEVNIDVSEKTDPQRKLIASIKSALDEYKWSATRLVCEDIIRSLSEVIFLHVREPMAIDISKTILQDHANVKTLFIDKPDANRHAGNPADEGVENYGYDDYITNGGSLDDLKAQAIVYAKKFL